MIESTEVRIFSNLVAELLPLGTLRDHGIVNRGKSGKVFLV